MNKDIIIYEILCENNIDTLQSLKEIINERIKDLKEGCEKE